MSSPNGARIDLISEIASAVIAVVAILTTCLLALRSQQIPSTIMVIDGVAVGFYFGQKMGQSAVHTVANMAAEAKQQQGP